MCDFAQVVRKSISEYVTFEQRPEWSRKMSHSNIWKLSALGRGTANAKDLRWGCVQNAPMYVTV